MAALILIVPPAKTAVFGPFAETLIVRARVIVPLGALRLTVPPVPPTVVETDMADINGWGPEVAFER